MCYYIGIESLVVGALIELLQRDPASKSVTFSAIEKYGNAVVKCLRDQGEEAVLILSRENTRGLIRDCSDIFQVESPDSPDGRIELRENVSVKDLAKRFSGGMAVAVIKALSDARTTRELVAA